LNPFEQDSMHREWQLGITLTSPLHLMYRVVQQHHGNEY